MFAPIAVAFVTLAAATVSGATAIPRHGGSECSTGAVQCCDSLQSANTPAVSTLLGLLGIPIQGVTGLVGVTCSPITVIGTASNSCNAEAVCCENNSFNGVVSLGCAPIKL